jgi:hypothetical protein
MEENNQKQQLVQVLANIHYKCQNKIAGFIGILIFSMIAQNALAHALDKVPYYTEDEMANLIKDMESKLSLTVVNKGISVGIDKPKSMFTKITTWFKNLL